MASEDVKTAIGSGHWREMYAVRIGLTSPIRVVDAEHPVYLNTGDGEPSGPQPLSLPFLLDFSTSTVGQAPEGWADPGYPFNGGNYALPVVATNKIAGWNPNRQCLHADVTAATAKVAHYQLPGYVDATAGFRAAYWMVTEVSATADSQMIFSQDSHGDFPDFRGILFRPRSVSPQDFERYGCAGAAGVKHTPASVLGASGPNYWCRYLVEWNPVANTLYTSVVRVDNSVNLHGPITVTPTWGANVAAVFERLNYVTLYAPQEANQYYRDIWLLGFWLGSLSDSWPALQMPTSV